VDAQVATANRIPWSSTAKFSRNGVLVASLAGSAATYTRVSGINVNPPASGTTVFSQYPVIAANNGPSNGSASAIVISFPAAGSYPYELDYKSGTGGNLSLAVTITQGAATVGLPPLNTLLLTYTGTAAPRIGQPASFRVLAKDETGSPVAQLPITFNVGGVNPQTVPATTDSTGTATLTYTGGTAGTDLIQATGTINGQAAVSNHASVTWVSAQAPQISVTGDATVTLPATGSYTATVTDPTGGSGGAISVNWTQVSGPGTVIFDAPQQALTHVLYPAPGSYVLQITATDSLGSNYLQVPVTVNPPVNLSQGWIGSPTNLSQVSRLVPITVASGVTLASGTLSYYPVSNSNAVVTLNASTTGSGTIGTLDTTTLANGTYYVLLSATNSTGTTQGSGIYLTVQGDYKPGVTTTVTDLVVPAPGLPIQIQRTYDSLTRSTSSDFGLGWTLGVNVELQIAPMPYVTLTINGQKRTFYFTPPGNVLGITTPAYTAEPGFYGSLTSPRATAAAASATWW